MLSLPFLTHANCLVRSNGRTDVLSSFGITVKWVFKETEAKAMKIEPLLGLISRSLLQDSQGATSPLLSTIPSHPMPLSHFNHFDHVALGSGTSQECISKSGKFSPPALGLLCTAYSIENSTSSSPLHLQCLHHHSRLIHTSVTLNVRFLPPKPLKPTRLREKSAQLHLSVKSLRVPWQR